MSSRQNLSNETKRSIEYIAEHIHLFLMSFRCSFWEVSMVTIFNTFVTASAELFARRDTCTFLLRRF